MRVMAEEASRLRAYGSWVVVGGRIEDPPAVAVLRQVTAAATPRFRAAARSRLEGREAPASPQVDRGPIFWPLVLVALLLAAVAVVVAPTGAVALPP